MLSKEGEIKRKPKRICHIWHNSFRSVFSQLLSRFSTKIHTLTCVFSRNWLIYESSQLILKIVEGSKGNQGKRNRVVIRVATEKGVPRGRAAQGRGRRGCNAWWGHLDGAAARISLEKERLVEIERGFNDTTQIDGKDNVGAF